MARFSDEADAIVADSEWAAALKIEDEDECYRRGHELYDAMWRSGDGELPPVRRLPSYRQWLLRFKDRLHREAVPE